MEKNCPIAKTLGFLGKKWALMILKELNDSGKKRFNELVYGISGISPRTLSKRLKELEKNKLISKKRFNEIPPKVEYSLTPKGKELIKCFKHLNSWAEKFETIQKQQ